MSKLHLRVSAAAQVRAPEFPAEQIKTGADLFARNCATCHGARMHNPQWAVPQELLNTARHHCQAIQTIIDQLTETKSDTELRLLSQRLQRLAFHAAPPSRAVEKVRTR